LVGALTIVKSYNGDTPTSTTAQAYYGTQSSLYLFGRNAGVSIISNNSEEGKIAFGNASTPIYASITTGSGTSSVGGDMYFKVGSDTERMRITSTGNVGIGATPFNWYSLNYVTLQIGGMSGIISNTGTTSVGGSSSFTYNLYVDTSGNYQYMNTTSARSGSLIGLEGGSIVFYNAPSGTGANPVVSERMRITSGGVVQINTTAGGATLNLKAQAGNNIIRLQNTSNGDGSIYAYGTSTTFNYAFNTYSVADAFYLYNSGNYDFAGSDVSDRRLKENINTIDYNATEKLMQLVPKSYNMIKHPDTKRNGFIAQEVQKILPDLITGTESEDDYLGLDYNGLLAIAVKAIQELNTKLQDQQQTINSLINR
jgi:hypothetical protein